MGDLEQLHAWAAPLLAKLQPAERRALARKLATALRRSQAQRIGEQRNPDGSDYAPRKRQKAGRIKRRRGRMFERIARRQHLKVEATEQAASVAFLGRVARIARVHQEGRRDRVARRGPVVRYERRQLLGFSEADHRMIRDLLTEHLAG
ncbi:phage virion morphogenesis protein [Vulcaniibacterium tengchongense]|uniref:Phage virion morphogenesis protein n=1 Tax=Vulcaniibacterium tengchongense TaxID=1273429 RepID=A0A3N4VNG7_9GAMM|nr:phage virion morphogenesis protein [Vulcaniibacterium tengchongense]RPE74624.1 phage virion morphogenesis protein [Vulcaniibacterium tengchongense]